MVNQESQERGKIDDEPNPKRVTAMHCTVLVQSGFLLSGQLPQSRENRQLATIYCKQNL